MIGASSNDESCGPQQPPSENWNADQLGRYAQSQNEDINAGERYLTPSYWRLGQALHLARTKVKNGWGEFLETWGIDKTRASKARAIYKTFGDPDKVSEMSVEQAYDKRERRVVRPRKAVGTKSGLEHPPSLTEFVLEIRKWAGLLLDKAAVITEMRAQALLPEITAAVTELKRLEETIEHRIAGK